MPKVFYVLDTLQTGGAERSTLDIASRLTTFEVVVCHIYKNDFLKSEFEELGIRVLSLNVPGPYQFLKAYRTLKQALEQEKPDLVVATLLRAELVSRMACWSLGIPNIGTFVNDTYSPYEWKALSLPMKVKIGFFWIINMTTARLCSGFLSNGDSIKKSNSKALHVPVEKIKVIYRGRRTDLFVYQERTPDLERMRFLAVGRLLYRKGFEELISAFELHHHHFPQATLTIAGDGPWHRRLSQMIVERRLEQSIFLVGTVKEMPALMAAHDAFVFPSHYEGFSGTVVEAMLSGIPIVASAIDMNMEALEHEHTAWLFPVQNVKALSEGMRFVTENFKMAKSYAQAARKVAEIRFDINAIAVQHEDYYRHILALKE